MKPPRGNLNFLSSRTRTVCARENPHPVAAAGRGRTSKEGESEATSLFAELQAQVCASPKGKTDVWTSFPEPGSLRLSGDPGSLSVWWQMPCAAVRCAHPSPRRPLGHTEIHQVVLCWSRLIRAHWRGFRSQLRDHWELEISPIRCAYTTEIHKCCQSGLPRRAGFTSTVPATLSLAVLLVAARTARSLPVSPCPKPLYFSPGGFLVVSFQLLPSLEPLSLRLHLSSVGKPSSGPAGKLWCNPSTLSGHPVFLVLTESAAVCVTGV